MLFALAKPPRTTRHRFVRTARNGGQEKHLGNCWPYNANETGEKTRIRLHACVMFLQRFCRASYRNLRRIKLINAFFPTATHCFIGFILGIRLDYLLGIHNPRSVRLKKRLELNILTSNRLLFELPARLNFQFALSAMGASKIRNSAER